MSITSQPHPLSFAADCKDLTFTATVATTITFKKDGVTFLEEEYIPFSGVISVKIKDIIKDLLYPEIPTALPYIQTSQAATFTLEFGTETIEFYAIAGGIGTEDSIESYRKLNLLTNRPQVVSVDKVNPFYVSYFAFCSSVYNIQVILNVYKADGTHIHVVFRPTSKSIMTLKLDYEYISTIDAEAVAVDVQIYNPDSGDNYYSYPYRFIFNRQSLPTDDCFLFENSQGALESIVFDGELEQIQNHKSTSYKIDDITHEYRNEYARTFKKSTGYFKTEELRLWASEFFSSKKRYHLVNGEPKEIYLNSMDLKSVLYSLNDGAFEFAYAEDSRYRAVSRSLTLPAL